MLDTSGLAWADRSTPEPAPGEAMIRPTLVGVASSDLSAIAGRLAFRGVLGHEFVGIVERVAGDREAQKRWIGRRVVGSPGVPCGACHWCGRGLAAHCQDRRVLGLHRLDGCFAPRFVLPTANLVEVPKVLPDVAAIFAGEVAGAAHAAHLARFENKTYVTVLGDGPAALITAQILTALNASVRVLGMSSAKFSLCEKWGIRHRHVNEAGRRRDQDVVIECTGSPEGLEVAMQLARPRGMIIARTAPAMVPISGLVGGVPGADLSPAVCNELTIIGAGEGSLRDGVDALVRGGVDVANLVTRRAKFADLPAAIALAQRPETLKVIVDGPVE